MLAPQNGVRQPHGSVSTRELHVACCHPCWCRKEPVSLCTKSSFSPCDIEGAIEGRILSTYAARETGPQTVLALTQATHCSSSGPGRWASDIAAFVVNKRAVRKVLWPLSPYCAPENYLGPASPKTPRTIAECGSFWPWVAWATAMPVLSQARSSAPACLWLSSRRRGPSLPGRGGSGGADLFWNLGPCRGLVEPVTQRTSSPFWVLFVFI